MCSFHSRIALFHTDRILRKMLIIFIGNGDGHCIQWQCRKEQATLGWEISPYLVERQTDWAETAGPANAVWWQAHEISSVLGQSHSPSGETGGKYSSAFTSHKWIHTNTHVVVQSLSGLACLFPHPCRVRLHAFTNEMPWKPHTKALTIINCNLKVKHACWSDFQWRKQHGWLFYFSVHCIDSNPTCTPAHPQRDHESTLLSFVWVFVWFLYHSWPADRRRINHWDSDCSATWMRSTTPDRTKDRDGQRHKEAWFFIISPVP